MIDSDALHRAADLTDDAADHDELRAAGAAVQLNWGLLGLIDQDYLRRWVAGLGERHGIDR